METLIDICLPTNNSDAGYLKQAIESAFAQTEKRWRMYIRDNCSEVDVQKIVEPYLKDPRVSFVRSDHKGTIGYNWNKTMELGNAPYVQFLFQDDWWEPQLLEKGIAAMERHPGIGFVAFEHAYKGQEGHELPAMYAWLTDFRRTQLPHLTSEGLKNGRATLRDWLRYELSPNLTGEPVFQMFRRSVMQKVGTFAEDMEYNLDIEYALRCLTVADWYHVAENCGTFRVHDEAMSAVIRREGRGKIDQCRCFDALIRALEPGDERSAAREKRAVLLRRKAAAFVRARREPGGRAAFREFARYYPLQTLRAILLPERP